jgi:hypothetical protein
MGDRIHEQCSMEPRGARAGERTHAAGETIFYMLGTMKGSEEKGHKELSDKLTGSKEKQEAKT